MKAVISGLLSHYGMESPYPAYSSPNCHSSAENYGYSDSEGAYYQRYNGEDISTEYSQCKRTYSDCTQNYPHQFNNSQEYYDGSDSAYANQTYPNGPGYPYKTEDSRYSFEPFSKSEYSGYSGQYYDNRTNYVHDRQQIQYQNLGDCSVQQNGYSNHASDQCYWNGYKPYHVANNQSDCAYSTSTNSFVPSGQPSYNSEDNSCEGYNWDSIL